LQKLPAFEATAIGVCEKVRDKTLVRRLDFIDNLAELGTQPWTILRKCGRINEFEWVSFVVDVAADTIDGGLILGFPSIGTGTNR
jgi:hypothetical protein